MSKRDWEWVGTPGVEVIQVVRVTFLRGHGIEGHPVRRVECFYTLAGTLLVERDPVRTQEASTFHSGRSDVTRAIGRYTDGNR